MRFSRIYAFGLVFFTLAWFPADHYPPWLSFHAELLAFLGLLGLLTSVLFQQSGPVVLPRASGWIAFAMLMPWLQYVFGISYFVGDALLSSLYLAGLLASVFIGYSFYRSAHGQRDYRFTGLMHGLWIAGMVSAAIGLVQWLNLQGHLGIYVVQTDIGDPAAGNLGQPNQLATLLLMGMVAYSYVFERRIIGVLVFVLGIVFMTAALVLTHSRAGMLGVLVISSFLLAKRSRVNSRLKSGQIVAWVLLFGLASLASPDIDRALLLNAEREPLFTSNGRTLIWLQVLEGIAKSPWLGYGWNQSSTAHMAGVVVYPGTATIIYAHNVLLDVIAWNGVPIGLLLNGLAIYWFCTRIFRISDLNASYAMACLLPFTVHSLVEFPFAYAYFLFTAGIMMGVVEASMGLEKVWHISRLWVSIALAAWVMIGSYMAYEYLQIEEDFRAVRFENLRIGTAETSYQVPDIWMLSHMGTMLKVARQPAVPNMTAQQLNDLRRVSTRFPYGTLNLRYALALGLNGDPTGARYMMAVIHGLHGDKFYLRAKVAWNENAEKYPQLRAINLP